MKKTTLIHVIVMVVSVAIASYLANTLLKDQLEIAKSRNELSATPLGGFNKFASDVQWMFFVNYCGKAGSVTKDNKDEIYKRLNKILRNDPDFVKAYKIGAMMLSVKAPIKSIEILTRGTNNPNLKSQWEIPYLAGFVLLHHVDDAKWEAYVDEYNKKIEDEKGTPKLSRSRIAQAEKMYKLAVQRGKPASYSAVASLLRSRAMRMAKRKDIVNEQHAYLYVLYDIWKESQTENMDGGIEGASSLTGPIDFEKRILSAAQEAKASAPDNKKILATVKNVTAQVLSHQHLCPNCLSKYNAGDKFCSSCGTEVMVFGACEKCGAIMKGKHCSKCGHVNKK